jgi:16S rRNA (guanine527-N7)-methyltransferase
VLSPAQCAGLLDFLDLLSRWGRVYNLTAVREPGQMLTQHLLDSLAVWPALGRALQARVAPAAGAAGAAGATRATEATEATGPSAEPSLSSSHPIPGSPSGLAGEPSARLLDVGSGAGLPGVVLAIVAPALHVTCVDTVGKKAGFVRQAAAELGLANLRAQHARVEALATPEPGAGFDVITSRAFASLADFVQASQLQLAPGGVWMAMKGQVPEEEVSVLPESVEVFHVEQLVVPGLAARRCLVWMRRRG